MKHHRTINADYLVKTINLRKNKNRTTKIREIIASRNEFRNLQNFKMKCKLIVTLIGFGSNSKNLNLLP